MSETGRGKKRNRKKKERNIILMKGGNKKILLEFNFELQLTVINGCALLLNR